MGILGNVENGWFAQLAHGGEWLGRNALNMVSFGNQWGDKFYGQMHELANDHMAAVSQRAVDQALAGGQSAQRALSSANAVLDSRADPKSLSDLAQLAGDGTAVAGKTVVQAGTDLVTSAGGNALMEVLKGLTPLWIGAGALGGAYLISNSLSSGETPVPSSLPKVNKKAASPAMG